MTIRVNCPDCEGVSDLDTKSAAELNELFALEVAGWAFRRFPHGALPDVKHWSDAIGRTVSIFTDGNFCDSSDAVLPWLEKAFRFHAHGNTEKTTVQVEITATHWHLYKADAPTFARAAVIALIRSKRKPCPRCNGTGEVLETVIHP